MAGLALVEKCVFLEQETSSDDRVCGRRQVTVRYLMALTSEMARSVHPLMQNAYDRDSIVRRLQINYVAADALTAVAAPYPVALLRSLRRLRQHT